MNSSINLNKKEAASIDVEVNQHLGDCGLTGLGILEFLH